MLEFSRVLIDTNVVSEMTKRAVDPNVEAWIRSMRVDQMFLSAITIGEITRGIVQHPDAQRREQLAAWLAGLEADFADRILPVDVRIAHRWGELVAKMKVIGVGADLPDSLIAATALVHDLVVVTRNVADFEHTGVPLHNPWNR